MAKELLLGNFAVAQGALDAGIRLVSSYPGTPSTEITEYLGKTRSIHAEWAPNEKVAAEVACGAAFGGARALCCMKHVGLNVAADPLLTAAYTGVRAGLVIAVADDPGMHSSQNEQDTRYYARLAHLPLLEPADSQECYSFTRLAFALSEEYDTPVLLRLTTRVSHSQSLVERTPAETPALRPYEKDAAKYVMMPAMARKRHLAVAKREARLRLAAEDMAENRTETRGEMGVICAGIVYQYAREALPEASILKLGLVNPLPEKRIKEFAAAHKELWVLEELEPIIEKQVREMGISCRGKAELTDQGEYSVALLRKIILQQQTESFEPEDIPVRPPVLCPGCPHRAVFYVLQKLKLSVMGDIGCYTLGANPPLSGMDACLCMGASIGMAHGMDRSGALDPSRTVAVIGDSTFLHSGLTGLANIAYNGGKSTVLILDNSITGMTGHQQNPATGKDLRGEPAPAVNLQALCQALGAGYVAVADPHDFTNFTAKLKQALAYNGLSVVIAKRPCALLDKTPHTPLLVTDACTRCGICLRLGCPAIEKRGASYINPALCVGCGQCAALCPAHAIVKGAGV